MHGDGCRLYGTCWKMMLQWLFRLSCRPVIVNGLDRTMRMNTEYGLDRIMMTNTDSPRLAVTAGEWYVSDMLTTMKTDLRQMNGIPEVIGAMYVCRTVWGFPQIDSTAVDCGAVELDDLTFHQTSFPPDEFSAGRDGNYMEDYSMAWGFPQIDSAAVDCDTGAVELDDLIFRLPRPRCHRTQQRIRRLSLFPSTVFSLYEGTHRLWLERPCCSRRQLTVWLRVWGIQTLLHGVNSIRGQNPLGLCLDVRLPGLYCRPDPPVLLTGSALRISTTLPEGSSTSATPVAPGEGGGLQSGLPSRPYRYSE